VYRWTTNIHKFTRHTTTRTWGKPPPSPLEHFLWSTIRVASKCHFFSGLPSWESWNSWNWDFWHFWKAITFCVNLRLKWSLKQSCSPCRKISNNMWHAIYTHIFQGDSWFLMVRNQIGILTLGLSFGHNLCFRYSNGSCKPIFDTFVSRNFQWYKELFDLMNFDP